MEENQKWSRESLAQHLRKHGITPTHQRTEIAHALFSRHEHLSAEQILTCVNARDAETSKATVYNTLKLFVEKRLIRELVVHPARIVYDPNMEPHHHLYEVETGRLTDIPAADVQVVGLPQLPEGTEAESIDVIVRTRRRTETA